MKRLQSMPTSELTELLRAKTPGDYRGLYDTILSRKNALAKL